MTVSSNQFCGHGQRLCFLNEALYTTTRRWLLHNRHASQIWLLQQTIAIWSQSIVFHHDGWWFRSSSGWCSSRGWKICCIRRKGRWHAGPLCGWSIVQKLAIVAVETGARRGKIATHDGLTGWYNILHHGWNFMDTWYGSLRTRAVSWRLKLVA